MEQPSKETRHRELNEFVTMAEACVTACIQVEGGSPSGTLGSARNRYAELLAKCLTVYSISDDRERISALEPNDVRAGEFRDGGREVLLADGRSFGNLAVRRSALKSAIELLKRAHGKPPQASS